MIRRFFIDKFKEVIILRDVQGFAYEEISQILNIPLGTVKSRVNRGRLKLQEDLKFLFESETRGSVLPCSLAPLAGG